MLEALYQKLHKIYKIYLLFCSKVWKSFVKCYRVYDNIIHNTEDSVMFFSNKINHLPSVSGCSFCGKQLFRGQILSEDFSLE